MKKIVTSFAVIAIVLAVGTLMADNTGLRPYEGGPVGESLADILPAVERGPMTVSHDATRALSTLIIDDGSCESGLGVGTTAAQTALHEFDVPTQCIQGGLDIVGLTMRVNTLGQDITLFAYAQAGATPPGPGTLPTVPISAMTGPGPCPATDFQTRVMTPGSAVITGTSNFFAGVVAFGFVGRDTTTPQGRMWTLCATCSNSIYSPTDLSGFGLGGNWMIRVTVEDANCVPVELMGFTVS